MTDQITPTTNGQRQNPSTQQPKKNFFGGEVNFNDTNFEVHGEQPPKTDEIAPISYAPEPEKAEEIISFEPEITVDPVETETDELTDFDPFGDDEETETVETIEPTQPIEEVQPDEIVEEPIEETIEDSSAEEIEEKAEKEKVSLPIEETEEETEEEEIEQNIEPEETIELEPSKKTGNELFDKFLSLTDTARAIFALQEDKSNFKIIGGKTADNLLEYFVYLIEDEADHIDLFIKKVETQDDEEEEHLLQWTYTTTSQHLDIFVDEMLLYQFTKDNKEANGITDKLNKF
ncbi:MAG: hypothetical protein LBD11_06710 [Candidatus Peribacteria bacterium]|jgi:hypothetical protein|nr:hypothetical protein [Candidatus Peribacteria bacterium]